MTMDRKSALVMDLDYDIKCALEANHLVSPGPLACAYFNQSRAAFLTCDMCRAGTRPIGVTCIDLMVKDVDSRFREICNATI